MIDERNRGASFVAQLYDIRTKRDGGGRIALDFGADGLEAVQFIQKLATYGGDCNFSVAIVALPHGQTNSLDPDPETGEIPL